MESSKRFIDVGQGNNKQSPKDYIHQILQAKKADLQKTIAEKKYNQNKYLTKVKLEKLEEKEKIAKQTEAVRKLYYIPGEGKGARDRSVKPRARQLSPLVIEMKGKLDLPWTSKRYSQNNST